jgi:hypothetical protein
MKHELPEEYDHIEVYCNNLPLNNSPGTHPFAGIVVNFCVSTDSHRDWSDNVLCVVIPFGTWEDGEIVLFELKLVIKMKSGDVLFFPSCHITHFNLHFSGLRGSIVLHSDGTGKNWVDNLNGWGNHVLST